MNAHGAGDLAGKRYRFRFLVRGGQTDDLLRLAVHSLERCHPEAVVAVVDANDRPTVDPDLFGLTLAHDVVHLRPGHDVVAKELGRGSRQHLFHWRHSPEVRAVLPAFDGFDAHADADLLFLRPLDLAALAGPLGDGRIAAAIDESTLDHYEAIGNTAVRSPSVGPYGGSPGGPMWQTGLIFSNPAGDGGFYDLVWAAACRAAEAGGLATLPDDDMALVSAVLGYGSDLWCRALPLGHDWNYITDAVKDPGIFGRVAHYGGRRAKTHLLSRTAPLLPRSGGRPEQPWGTVHRTAGGPHDAIGPARGLFDGPLIDEPVPPTSLLLPLCLTWAVPRRAESIKIVATVSENDWDRDPGWATAALHVYTDGRLRERIVTAGEGAILTLDIAAASTVTVIAVGDRRGLALRSLELTTTGDSR